MLFALGNAICSSECVVCPWSREANINSSPQCRSSPLDLGKIEALQPFATYNMTTYSGYCH